MRYVSSRLCGLLNRQITTYSRLVEEMLEERKALLSRDLENLHASMERQQNLVDEIYDIMRDYEEEVEHLYREHGIPRRHSAKTEALLRQKLGRDAGRVISLSEKLRKMVEKARQVNRQNQRILEVSDVFFKSYFHVLSQIRAQAFGYNRKGHGLGYYGRNLAVNQNA